MVAIMKRLCRDCAGATAVEYGLIVGFIAIGILTAITLTGDELVNVFNAVADGLRNST